MNFKPYTDKIEFTCCLAHTITTPHEFCERANECQRAIALRHYIVDPNNLVERMCVTNKFEEFLA